MVILNIKKGDESLFLYETTVSAAIEDTIKQISTLQNGRLKVYRICSHMELLTEHGPGLPPEMHGLTQEQIEELKLKDEWQEQYQPEEGQTLNRDPCGKRNGRQPRKEMQELIKKTIAEAKSLISKEHVKSNVCLKEEHVHDALEILQGAVTIAYPMGLPTWDPVRQELENHENLENTYDEKQVLDPAVAQLWFAGKELLCGKKLRDYIGKNEKTKVIIKVQKRGFGAPAREPVMSEEDKKNLMLAEFRRREELKKLEEDADDSYLNSAWSDNQHLKKSFQGLSNITWKPH